jgi:hypothetical protein
LIARPLRTLFARSFHPEHREHDRTRRNLLILSLANWGIAITSWTVSAYLGVTSPARIIVYTVLFVIGLFAAMVAVASYLLEKFAHRPAPVPAQTAAGDEQGTPAVPGA